MQETFTDWTLVSLSPLGLGALIALSLGVVAAVALVLWSYRGARRRWLLGTMRFLAGVIVLAFLLEPALQLRVVRKIRNRLAVVVDRSRSMTLGTADGRTRYDNVLHLLENDRRALDALSESHVVEWFDLDGPTSSAALETPPVGERSDLLGALERAKATGAGRPLAGVVLISDGADNADLLDPRGTLSEQAKARLSRLEVPVTTFDAAASGSFRDVAIADVVSDDFGFLHNTLEIEVVLTSSGVGAQSVPVTLKRESDVLATQVAELRDGTPVHLTFKTKPDQIGEFVYSVSIPAIDGDTVAANNQRSFVLQVIRDKIRVLQVAGRPSWDERFLRQHLKENPNVDLISFFILRSPTDDPSVPEKELSLIPFPVQKLFTTELKSFDVVILQNFDYAPYNMAIYLANIRDAVKGGLGFVMIGGEQSFGTRYQGTELDEIIPVRLDMTGMREGAIVTELTDAGRRHPVTDLVRGTGNNDKAWAKLPAFTSLNLSAGLAANATALVTAKGERLPGGAGVPMVAVMDVGEGRSMAIATDSMWRWRFSATKEGSLAERAYHRFWSNALHWLVRDPEHSRIRVLPEKRRFDVAEAADVTFRVLGRDYQPMPFAHLRASLERADGTAVRMDDVTAGDAGVARHRYTGLEPGAYRVIATASASGEELGKGRGVFVVESTSLELSRGSPRPDALRAIADATEGSYVPLEPGAWDRATVVDPDVVEVARRRNIELWDNAWGISLGIGLLALEWAVRRRRGYL
jgi:uncharacterized membrane protein